MRLCKQNIQRLSLLSHSIALSLLLTLSLSVLLHSRSISPTLYFSFRFVTIFLNLFFLLFFSPSSSFCSLSHFVSLYLSPFSLLFFLPFSPNLSLSNTHILTFSLLSVYVSHSLFPRWIEGFELTRWLWASLTCLSINWILSEKLNCLLSSFHAFFATKTTKLQINVFSEEPKKKRERGYHRCKKFENSYKRS